MRQVFEPNLLNSLILMYVDHNSIGMASMNLIRITYELRILVNMIIDYGVCFHTTEAHSS